MDHHEQKEQVANINATPMGKRLLIEEIIEEEKSASGLVLPDKKPKTGAVKGRIYNFSVLCEQRFEIGGYVLFNKFSPVEITCDGKPLLLVNEADVLAKITLN